MTAADPGKAVPAHGINFVHEQKARRIFTALVKEILTGMGYSVRLNDPFKGAELVTRYSEPRAGRHSLQIEINRRLYLDEAAIAKTADFDALRADMRRLIAGVVRYARKSV